MANELFLFDTNAIIEAVRTSVWNAVSGALRVETVEEVRRECLRGEQRSSGYIEVPSAALERATAIHSVSNEMRAAVALMEGVNALHDGERDLFAYINNQDLEGAWWVCSPDMGSIRFAVIHGIPDQLVSLEEVAGRVGARPKPAFENHFTTKWLAHKRTEALLDNL